MRVPLSADGVRETKAPPNMLTVPRAPHLTERQKDAFTNQGDSGCVLEECCKKPWSHVSYWECNRHIGHKWLPVITSALVVLNEEHYSVSAATAENTSTHAVWSQQGRLCLDRLVRHFTSPRAFSEESHPSRKIYHPSILHSSSPTKQRRRLSHEGISLLLLPKGQILLTNKTLTTPIFVASPCFVQPGDLIAGDWPVYRVAPACSLVVFDTRIYEDRLTEAGKYTPWPGKSLFGPVLHISLGKGWGPAYRRTDFTHCPARLEIWLNLSTIKSHTSSGLQ
ncbi:mothers against decapentaplegic 6 [Echinococcus multilocularis]|uniref:Mothers against decapentaplegic 6 n=1 Tax=Echinococcus multilocularis TaxID=6211 RepID=A0A068YDZ8_ECHMU|nr:mothers against decapentaplegic 6 [Echinococcus multilocularis]